MDASIGNDERRELTSEDAESSGGLFDRFAEAASEFASHAAFFIGCVLLVVIWAPSYAVIGNLNTWQLIINTATTIVTFLLVALLQNSQRRNESAFNQKLDALADGLADLMEHVGATELERDIADLRESVGVEKPTG
jgi:low affinity Fe/Cu permease